MRRLFHAYSLECRESESVIERGRQLIGLGKSPMNIPHWLIGLAIFDGLPASLPSPSGRANK